MKLSGGTKVHELLTAHPFLEEFLAAYDPKFEMLKNRMARATIGRVATLRTAAGIASIDLGRLLEDVASEIEKQTGERPEVDRAAMAPGSTREQRLQMLREIIADLHAGGDLEDAKKRFSETVEDVEPSEIAAMEEELIRSGLPVSEVQRLCDVHVGAFRQALDEHSEVRAEPGHPVHTYIAANKVITELANELAAVAREVERGGDETDKLRQALPIIEQLRGIENHYQRKENQLFPVLERHDVTGPSQVMWGVHDQIRGELRAVRAAAEKRDAKTFATTATALARDLVEMVYKEEKILFPMALEAISEQEWAEIRRGEDELGYVLAKPAAGWSGRDAAETKRGPSAEGVLELSTGKLSPDQLNLILTHLPVDISFIDEDDTVRFYSEGPERIFPRSPAVIGRKVQKCHPPKSVNVVQEILDSFRARKQDVAEFWIQLEGKFIHIRYFAVRDKAGAYRGCLEVSQDVTGIRSLDGERRLLQWETGEA
ncbi:MAG: hypothetical protein AMJ46_01900 [Latescibacteria bacterium DG_63]|nr:MAG: hypothetical protein AMJ46_01900 [Latescibacteria bacterium DG_63]